MKPSLLILSTESIAEVLHDEHARQIALSQDQASFTPWIHKVRQTKHVEECQLWRDVAERFTKHLMSWLSAGAQTPASSSVPAEPPIKNASGSPTPDFEFMAAQECAQAADALQAEVNRKNTRITELETRLTEVKAELERKRQAENDLIRDRDRLIHKDLAEAHAAVQRLLKERDALAQEKDLACERAQKMEERIINLREAIRVL